MPKNLTLIGQKLGINKRKSSEIRLVNVRNKGFVARRQPGCFVREFSVEVIKRTLRFLQKK